MGFGNSPLNTQKNFGPFFLKVNEKCIFLPFQHLNISLVLTIFFCTVRYLDICVTRKFFFLMKIQKQGFQI